MIISIIFDDTVRINIAQIVLVIPNRKAPRIIINVLIILLHWPIGILKYLFKIDANISEPPVLKPDRYIIPLAIPIDIEDTKTIKNSFQN